MKISFLKEVPEFMGELAEAHGNEWEHLYLDWNRQTALEEFQKETGGESIPFTLVLHDSGFLGSVSLVLDDLPTRKDLNPWLASLFVIPEQRGRGLGNVLVEAAISHAKTLGVPNLFAFTESAESFFLKKNFEVLGKEMAHDKDVSLMVYRCER